ncbi:MAG: hypothetical protein NUW01_06200 [Gemmatimonadaceae bacterium]|nr:hypothetical protein [Gemmatimonadaceae bacterium]
MGAYWALELNHRAATISTVAPNQTIQLTATPRSVAGDPIAGLGAVTFTSGNPDVVHVDADGLVTAKGPTFGVLVIAQLTATGITHADTAMVQVTADPPRTLATFSIQPVAPDSAKFALGGTFTQSFRALGAVARDTDGNQIFGLPVHFASLDRTTATIDPRSGSIAGIRPGSVRLVATTTAYGITRADTVSFRIGLPLIVDVLIRDSVLLATTPSPNLFTPGTVTIGTGGVVRWTNATTDSTDVTFDNPANVTAVPEWENCLFFGAPCDAGNIAPFAWGGNFDDFSDLVMNLQRVRRFAAPGVYRYRSTRFGMAGTIVVVDESQ